MASVTSCEVPRKPGRGVDHVGADVARVVEGLRDHRRRRQRAGAAEDLDRHDLGRGRDARDPDRVVLERRDRAGDVRAVEVGLRLDSCCRWIDVVPAQPVVDLAVGVVVDAVGLASEAALTRIAAELAGEVRLRGPRRRCRRPRRSPPSPPSSSPTPPGASMSASGVPKANTDWPVLCRPHMFGEPAVVGLQRDHQVRLGVEDVGVGVQRLQRRVRLAHRRGHPLGVRQTSAPRRA